MARASGRAATMRRENMLGDSQKEQRACGGRRHTLWRKCGGSMGGEVGVWFAMSSIECQALTSV